MNSNAMYRRADRRATIALFELEQRARNLRLGLERGDKLDAEAARSLAEHASRVASELAVMETVRDLDGVPDPDPQSFTEMPTGTPAEKAMAHLELVKQGGMTHVVEHLMAKHSFRSSELVDHPLDDLLRQHADKHPQGEVTP